MKLLLSLLLVLALGLLAWRLLDAARPATASIDSHAESLQEFLERRSRNGASGPEAPGPRRAPLSEEEARELFAMPRESFVWDPQVVYRYVPDSRLRIDWPEHPEGSFLRRTNAAGFREDRDEPAQDLDLFVLVAGDSHTDGICNNDESFANRLEAMLVERHPGRSVEVWNTGVHGYSFYNYLGALEKYLDRGPDVFVVATYGGNDFLDVVKVAHFFAGTAPPQRDRAYWTTLGAASKQCSAALAMALNQVYYFARFPDEVEVALEAVLGVTREILGLCEENGVVPVFVYIPTGYDLDAIPPDLARAQELLHLSAADLGLYDRMADRLLEELRARGVAAVDLRDSLSGHLDTLYWSDMHINLAGHELVARRLLPEVEAAWSPEEQPED